MCMYGDVSVEINITRRVVIKIGHVKTHDVRDHETVGEHYAEALIGSKDRFVLGPDQQSL